MIRELISHFHLLECHTIQVTFLQKCLILQLGQNTPRARTTSKCEPFYKTSRNLISRMSKQGFNITVFTRTLTKMPGRHFQTLKKFYNTSKEFIDSLTK